MLHAKLRWFPSRRFAGLRSAARHRLTLASPISRRKARLLRRASLIYAGDHLISHTLTRAVPSAQRGLTSVFGMGTGVTLAVNSPANSEERSRDPSQLNRLSRHLPCVYITTKLVLNILRNSGLALRRVNSMDKPNGRLVLVSYTHYCASTSSLSTRWSSWALIFPYGLGDLILERASRLYAFSGYHNRTSLPSRALGRTTGTQEVRPSRSSRTKDSPLQISYAHSR